MRSLAAGGVTEASSSNLAPLFVVLSPSSLWASEGLPFRNKATTLSALGGQANSKGVENEKLLICVIHSLSILSSRHFCKCLRFKSGPNTRK